MDELDRLARDLDAAADEMPRKARGVVSKGALNIKNDAQRFSSGLAHAPHYPRSIGYDLETVDEATTATIGPDKDKTQGALGNILEFGSPTSAPVAHLGPALDIEGPRFVDAMADIGEDIL